MQELFIKYRNYLEVEKSASPYTVRNYTTDLTDFFNFLRSRGTSSLRDIDRSILRDYLADLMERGFVKRSIARKLSAVRSLYRFLIREEIVETSPVKTRLRPGLTAACLNSFRLMKWPASSRARIRQTRSASVTEPYWNCFMLPVSALAKWSI